MGHATTIIAVTYCTTDVATDAVANATYAVANAAYATYAAYTAAAATLITHATTNDAIAGLATTRIVYRYALATRRIIIVDVADGTATKTYVPHVHDSRV